jgi:hypothetical protein
MEESGKNGDIQMNPSFSYPYVLFSYSGIGKERFCKAVSSSEHPDRVFPGFLGLSADG